MTRERNNKDGRPGVEIKPGSEWGFITSLPTSTPRQVARVYELYRRRWGIETDLFEELKRSWYINRFPGRSRRALYAHVMLTLFMFNAVKAFLSDRGRNLAAKGLMSLRNKYFRITDELIVYQGDLVGILSLRDFLVACGLSPPGKLDDFRIRIIWPGMDGYDS